MLEKGSAHGSNQKKTVDQEDEIMCLVENSTWVVGNVFLMVENSTRAVEKLI